MDYRAAARQTLTSGNNHMFNHMREPAFLRKFFFLALPIAFQELLIASLHIIDTIMIGKTGGTNMAAVNLANQPFFIFFLLMMAITSGASVFTAQYWGSRDMDGVSRSFGISFFGSLIAAAIFSIVSFIFAPQILGFYSPDPELIKQGVAYLRIVSLGYIFTATTVSLSALLRSTRQPRIPLIISMVSLTINTILNYILIFGKFGAPAMGVRGAAYATLISRAIEMILIYTIVYATNNRAAPRFKKMVSWTEEFIISYIKTSFPVLVNDIGWVTGFSFYSKIFASINTEAITAVTITNTAAHFFLILFFGTGHASATILGNQMGKGELEESRQDAYRILPLITLLSITISFLIIFASPYVPLFFNASDYIKNIASSLLVIFAFSLPFKVINMNVIAGVLRSGGDTIFSAALDIAGVWVIGVPMGLIATKILGWEIEAVFAIIMVEEVFKTVLCVWRMYSGKWVKKLV